MVVDIERLRTLALKSIKTTQCTYNFTISPAPRKYDDIDTYNIVQEDIIQALYLAKSSKKYDYDISFFFVKEKFKNTPTRVHYHGQVYVYCNNYPDLVHDEKERFIKEAQYFFCDKVYGIMCKKIGNTKMVKDDKLIHKDREYPTYVDYMIKELSDKTDQDYFTGHM